MNQITTMPEPELRALAKALCAEIPKAQALLHKAQKEIRRRKRAMKPVVQVLKQAAANLADDGGFIENMNAAAKPTQGAGNGTN